jgi:uncharacterized lipoprotein YddW (UPF0748 family)
MKLSRFGIGLLFVSLVLGLPGSIATAAFVGAPVSPPELQREYRGAWIATVANIDWPSSPALTPQQQRAELIAIMDRAVELKLNTLIFQVRPGCDALYRSQIEPWSEYLTGKMGQAPSPAYDPLQFAIEEAHKRGLELHAWFNPYRARHDSAKSPVSENHISKTKPHLVKTYGKALWLDPGEPEVQDYSLRVLMDVVRRYDVDGIHVDDYFYPYKVKGPDGTNVDFPDDQSWTKYGVGTKLTRDDWRRQNVNTFIEKVYKSIKTSKPWVKFGISPFGIWRPGYPAQIKGFDQYDQLYADARKWLQNGWCDYFAPQLYWRIEPPEQSFPALLSWWTEQNTKGRHLVPGMNSSSVPRAWKPDEIQQQISITRKPGASGHIHWNMKSLMRSAEFRDALKSSVYAQPAIPPQARWLNAKVPATPKASVSGSSSPELTWRHTGQEPVAFWLVQTSKNGKWTSKVLPGKARSLKLPETPEMIAVSCVSRYGGISKAAGLGLKR